MVRKIAVITGTRAEFGLLSPLIKRIEHDESLDLELIVTGMHLSPEFGLTVEEIRNFGYAIRDEVEILLSSDSSYGTVKSVGLGLIGFADSFRRLKPDIVVVLGDRFESFAAAAAAMIIGIPIAHIHGGERTEGLIDEPIRHSITKMSHLHFVSTEEYRRRVIQLGEEPGRVFNVGAIGLDRIELDKLVPKDEIARVLGIPANKPWCTVTYHPVTLDPDKTRTEFSELLASLSEHKDLFLVFTSANADEGGRLVNSMTRDYVRNSSKAVQFDSLGSVRYLSTVASSEIVVGNSSSGIIEAPFLRVPTVDIGIRQRGRVRGSSVFHAESNRKDITRTVDLVLQSKDTIDYANHPYYNGGAASRIMEIIKTFVASRMKFFFDVEFLLDE